LEGQAREIINYAPTGIRQGLPVTTTTCRAGQGAQTTIAPSSLAEEEKNFKRASLFQSGISAYATDLHNYYLTFI
jgi:hypothetical protein